MNDKALAKYEMLALSQEHLFCCAKLLTGELRLPFITFEQPPESYGFPPQLLPFTSSGSGPNYWGVLLNPLTPRADTLFVKFGLESQTMVEIARTPDQLFCYFALFILERTDGPSKALSQFAQQVRLRHTLAELDQLLMGSGDITKALLSLPEFSCDTPSFADLVSRQNGDASLPSEAFNAALDRDAPQEAWAALCLPGWTFAESVKSFERLTRRYQNSFLDNVFEAWMIEHAQMPGGY